MAKIDLRKKLEINCRVDAHLFISWGGHGECIYNNLFRYYGTKSSSLIIYHVTSMSSCVHFFFSTHSPSLLRHKPSTQSHLYEQESEIHNF